MARGPNSLVNAKTKSEENISPGDLLLNNSNCVGLVISVQILPPDYIIGSNSTPQFYIAQILRQGIKLCDDDVTYFQEKLMSALGIPKSFIGYK